MSEPGHKVEGWQPFRGDPFYPLFRAIVIRADNTLLKCLRLLYFHGGCARASLSDFLPSAARFRYSALCYMHASPSVDGVSPPAIGNASAHSCVSTEDTETWRETDAESLNLVYLRWPATVYNLLHTSIVNLVSWPFLLYSEKSLSNCAFLSSVLSSKICLRSVAHFA